MPIITSKTQLKQLLEQRATFALKSTQKIVGICIQESIDEYYREKVFNGGVSCIPKVYERTWELLNSLVKTDVVKVGNTLQCTVGISDEYLNYKYPGSNWENNIPATGRDVLEWNNSDGSHGYTVSGDWKIWEQAMQSLSGESGILSIFESNLKKYGIPIK